jgi:xyloglucan-specific exo-beta-1,4-glucanase
MKFKNSKLILLFSVFFGTCFGSSNVFAQTYTWSNVAIMGGGFISGIEASPAQSGLIYARTDVGGAYRWNDATSTWTAITDMFPITEGNYCGIESLAPDPSNANKVYIAGGMYEGSGNGVILSSTNQGNSWTINNIGLPMGSNEYGRGMGERLVVDPNLDSVLFFGSRTAGLWKSTNSAATWTQVASFPTIGPQNVANCYGGTSNFGLPVVFIDGQGGTAGTASAIIFVGVAGTAAGSNLYRSNNGGTSWTLVTGGPSGLMIHHASLGSDGNLWLAYSNDYGPNQVTCGTLTGQVWKYNVAAGTWDQCHPNDLGWNGRRHQC